MDALEAVQTLDVCGDSALLKVPAPNSYLEMLKPSSSKFSELKKLLEVPSRIYTEFSCHDLQLVGLV